jgi:hypothetical protein
LTTRDSVTAPTIVEHGHGLALGLLAGNHTAEDFEMCLDPGFVGAR